MKSTDWDAIVKRCEKSQKALDYMAEHPLTHEDAIEQSKRLRIMVLEDEIKRYTEEKFNETFGNGQGTFDEFDWEDISTVIEDTARHFYSLRPHWKPSEEQMEALVSMLNIGSLSYPGQMQTLIELKNDLKKLGKTGREPIPGIKTIF